MIRSPLIEQVKQAILEIEPRAEIVLYGSRSRGDFGEESDWDFLVLVEGTVDDERIDNIRHRLGCRNVATFCELNFPVFNPPIHLGF